MTILALGEDSPTMTGEAASRAWLGLPAVSQARCFEKVVRAPLENPRLLILFSGRASDAAVGV